MKQKVILIFDIGKTNKKYFLFEENLTLIRSEYKQIDEIVDEDGFPCDDLHSIEKWVMSTYQQISNSVDYRISAINFTTYGATLVHLDSSGHPCTPLYNYLKPIPTDTLDLFKSKYGDWSEWSRETASPFLGMLNAGLQLFWLKYKKPNVFRKINCTIFLPQYLSFRFTKDLVTEYTGLGCHTGMWDFGKSDFHIWMYSEKLTKLLPPLHSTTHVFTIAGNGIKCGVGIHDSSAALLPYVLMKRKPFILLSTGTWCVSLNPFNDSHLTSTELEENCLCYLQPEGKPVKAATFFMGNEFNKWVEFLDSHFNMGADYHKGIEYNNSFSSKAEAFKNPIFTRNIISEVEGGDYQLPDAEVMLFDSYDDAYHQLLRELLLLQIEKIYLVANDMVIHDIYIDGGFAKNKVFIKMLQEMMPEYNIIPSEMPLSTALGAAMLVTDKQIDSAKRDLFI